MDFQVRIIQDLKGLLSIQDEWKSIIERDNGFSVFALPEWHIAWWKSIGVGRRMIILVAEKEGRIYGILPLSIRRASWDELMLKILEFSGASQSDYHDVITTENQREDVLQAFEFPFDNLCESVDVIRLHNLFPQSSFYKWVKSKKNISAVKGSSPFLNLDKEDYGNLEKSWSGSHRGDVRRQKKRLKKLGDLTLEVYLGKYEIKQLLPSFFQTLKSKWESEGINPERVLSPAHNKFYSKLVDELSDGKRIHFSVLKLNGCTISYHYGFFYNDILYWYRPTYEKEYQNYSPGKVHISEIIELGCKEGWKEVDFLLGNEPYKFLWTSEERPSETLIFKGGGFLGSIGVKWISSWRDSFIQRLRGR